MHVRWECKHCVIFIPKCRPRAICGKFCASVGEILRDLCKQKEMARPEGRAMRDRVRLCQGIPPPPPLCLFRARPVLGPEENDMSTDCTAKRLRIGNLPPVRTAGSA